MADGFHRHVRLDSQERTKLLCRLDDRPDSPQGSDRRRWTRWEYRVSDIAVIVQHPGGGSGRFLVCTRNVSNGGVSFIHGGYLHPGSECRILLPRRSGPPLGVAGVVVHCRHVDGSLHEIGIQFVRQIDATVLLAGPGPDHGDRSGLAVELPAIAGRALIVDESDLDRRLVAHQIGATGLEMSMVSTPGAALDAVRREHFELILCELNVDAGGERMIAKMREHGVTTPIIVVTAERDVTRLRGARQAGANEIVGKPYAPEYLASVLAEWVEVPVEQRPVASTYADDPAMLVLVTEFIRDARRVGDHIAKALLDEDVVSLRELAIGLVGSGTSYGFSSLTRVARDTVTALDTSPSLADAARVVRRLISMCQRLRARPESDSAGRSVA